MPKDKIKRFAEYKSLPNCFEFPFELKGKWNEVVFQNNHPIVVELGCGKGEYTVELSEAFPEKNFIGVDLKSNRMWRGAKIAAESNRLNAAFCRLKIEKASQVFDRNEISEVWITFPDPFPKDRHAKHRLTHFRYLSIYQQFLQPNAVIHFKTDDDGLFDFTLEQFSELGIVPVEVERNVYASVTVDSYVKNIRTYYEKMFAAKGRNINYMKFSLTGIKLPHFGVSPLQGHQLYRS